MATNENSHSSANATSDVDNSLENLVRQVVSHPRFQEAVNNVNSNCENASTSREFPSNLSQNTPSNTRTPARTPREELQSLFNRGASLQQSLNIPQFQRRTSWTPSPTSRSQNLGKRNPFSKTTNKGKRKVKKTTFSREVVLLRRPSEGIVRGGAKAQLQRLGHILSSFEFDKAWSADEVLAKLVEAFKIPLDGMLAVTELSEPQCKIKIMMGMGNDLVEPQLTKEQSLTGEMISKIFTQRTIWLLPLKPIISSKEDQLEEEELDFDVFEDSEEGTSAKLCRPKIAKLDQVSHEDLHGNDITQYICTNASSGPIDKEKPTSTGHQQKVATLSEMFPSVDANHLSQALSSSNGALEDVIDSFLPKTEGDLNSSSDDDLPSVVWETPLAATEIVSSKDGWQSLQKFVDEAIHKFHEEIDIQVNRHSDILLQLIRKYKNPEFDLQKPLNVQFINEFGLDGGGVTREFFNMLMNSLITPKESGMNLFEGLVGHLLPRHDYDMLSGGLFKIMGKMILHSILNGCCGIAGLSPTVIAYLCTGHRDEAVQHLTLDDFPDPVLQEKLQELLSCESAKLIEFTNPDSPLCIIDELQNSGYPHIEITENNKRYAYECCLVNEVITKRLPALDDMRKGIGEVNVMGITLLFLLEDFPEIRARVFPSFENHVPAKDLRRHLVFEDSSNSKSAQAKHWFNQYIDELDQRDKDSGLENLSDLVQFWTSYPLLPYSISKILKVTYLEDSSTKLLAEANTCPMVLSIPVVHSSYDSFKAFLDKSISMAKVGFGKM